MDAEGANPNDRYAAGNSSRIRLICLGSSSKASESAVALGWQGFPRRATSGVVHFPSERTGLCVY
jgi:hypothetical protein